MIKRAKYVSKIVLIAVLVLCSLAGAWLIVPFSQKAFAEDTNVTPSAFLYKDGYTSVNVTAGSSITSSLVTTEKTTLVLGAGEHAIAAGAFQGFKKEFQIDASAATSLTIGANAFKNSNLRVFVGNVSTTGISESTIGANAFEGCENLNLVIVPNGVTTIEANTFKDTPKLSDVVLCDGYDVTSGTRTERINGVETIKEAAFQNSGIVHLTLPSSLKGPYSVSETDPELQKGIACSFTTTGNITKYGETNIWGDRTKFGCEVFSGCKNLVEVVNKSSNLETAILDMVFQNSMIQIATAHDTEEDKDKSYVYSKARDNGSDVKVLNIVAADESIAGYGGSTYKGFVTETDGKAEYLSNGEYEGELLYGHSANSSIFRTSTGLVFCRNYVLKGEDRTGTKYTLAGNNNIYQAENWYLGGYCGAAAGGKVELPDELTSATEQWSFNGVKYDYLTAEGGQIKANLYTGRSESGTANAVTSNYDIGKNAFAMNKNIEYLTISGAVSVVGDDAFNGHPLKSIVMGDHLRGVGTNAFFTSNDSLWTYINTRGTDWTGAFGTTTNIRFVYPTKSAFEADASNTTITQANATYLLTVTYVVNGRSAYSEEKLALGYTWVPDSEHENCWKKDTAVKLPNLADEKFGSGANALYAETKWYTGDNYSEWGKSLSAVEATNVISGNPSNVTLYARSIGTPTFHIASGTSPLIYNTGAYQDSNFLDSADTYEIVRQFAIATLENGDPDWEKAESVNRIINAGKYRLLVGLPSIYGTWDLDGMKAPDQGAINDDKTLFVSNTITIGSATNSWLIVPSLNGWAYKAFDVTKNTVALEAQFKQNNGTAANPDLWYPDCTVSFSNGGKTYQFNLKRVGTTNKYQFANGTDNLGDVLKDLPADEYAMTVTYPAIKNYSEISNTVHFQVTRAENDWSVRPTAEGWKVGALTADSVLVFAASAYAEADKTLTVTVNGQSYSLEQGTDGWIIGDSNSELLKYLNRLSAGSTTLSFSYPETANYNAIAPYSVNVTISKVTVGWDWGAGQSAPQGVIGGTVTGSYSDLSDDTGLAKMIPEFAVPDLPDLTAKGIEYVITYQYQSLGVTTRNAGTAYSTRESFIEAMKVAGAGTYSITVKATPQLITGTGAVEDADTSNYETLSNTYTLVINKAADGWLVGGNLVTQLPSYDNWTYKGGNKIAEITTKSGEAVTFTVGNQSFTGIEDGKDALAQLNEYLKDYCDVGTYTVFASTAGGNDWEALVGQFTVTIKQAQNDFKTEDSDGNPLNSKLSITQNKKTTSADGSNTGDNPILQWTWDDRTDNTVDIELTPFELVIAPESISYSLYSVDGNNQTLIKAFTSTETSTLIAKLKELTAGNYMLKIGTPATPNWLEAYRNISIEVSEAENAFEAGSLTVAGQSTLEWTWDGGAVEFDFKEFTTYFGTVEYRLDGTVVEANQLRIKLKALDAGDHTLTVAVPAVAGKYSAANRSIEFTVKSASNSFKKGRVEYLTQDNQVKRVSYSQASGTKEERTLSWTWGDTLRGFAVTLFESQYGNVFYELDGRLIVGNVQNELLQLNAGEHTLRIYTQTGNINYASAEMEIYFNVAKTNNGWLSTAQPMLNGWTYGETASELRGTPIYGVDDMTVQWQRKVGNSNVYENISAKPVDAGTYRAVLTVPASPAGNYDELSAVLDFVIAKAKPNIYNYGVNSWAWDHFNMYTSIRQASSTHNAQIHYAIVSAPGSANQVDLRFGYSDLTSEAKGSDGLTMAQRISALLAGDYILTLTTTVQDNYEEAVQNVEFTITTAPNSWVITPNIVSWVQFTFVPAENLPKAISYYGDVSMTVTNADRTKIYYTGIIIPERDAFGRLVTDENGEYKYTLNDAGGQYGDLVNMPADDYTLYISVASSAGRYDTLTSTTTFRIFSGSQQRPQNYWTTLPGMDMWISEMEEPAIPVGETLYWSQMKYEYFGAQLDESGNRYEPIDSEPLATQSRRIRRPSEDGEEVVQDPPTLVEGSNPVPQKPGWYIVRITAVLEGVGGVAVETLTHDVAFQIREAVNMWTDAPYVESWYINDGPSTPYAGKTSYESQVTFRYKTVEEEGVEPTYFDTMPTKPGKYIMIATARAIVVAEDGTVGYAKYCEPLVTEIPFSISLSINTWLQLPIIDSWSEEFGPNDPQGQVAHGNIVYTYFLKDGDNLIQLEEKPLTAGNYLLRATVEEYGYETLVSEVEFTITPAWDETFLMIDIVLGAIACVAAVAVIILAYRRKSQC